MGLEEDIRQQYAGRKGLDSLYNSAYAMEAHRELLAKMQELLEPFHIEKKTILEIGAGQGDNVNLLRACGFRDEQIFLNELLAERREAIKRNFSQIKLFEGDAVNLEFGQKFDFVMQSTVFTSVLKDEDRRRLAQKMWSLVKPGGFLLWYDFVFNNPRNSNVRKVSPGELKRLFPEAVPRSVTSLTLAPPIGRLVGKYYRLFNLPFLRTHILALFQKQG